MARQLRRRLTFANVCSFIALVIALGTGSAYAANTVGGGDVIDGSLTGADIQNESLDAAAELAPESLGSGRIKNNTVQGVDIQDNTIASTDVADESLTASDLATNSVGATEVQDSSIDTGEIVDNSLSAADLAPNSVASSEVAADAVGTSEVANESLTLSDIAGPAINASISLSGIPNGRCNQVTFSIGGAEVGDSPIVTTRAAIQNGIVLYPNRVASAGHVEVNACNFTGTSMTAISNFPVRVIMLR